MITPSDTNSHDGVSPSDLFVPSAANPSDGVGSHPFVSFTNGEHRPLAGDRSTPAISEHRPLAGNRSTPSPATTQPVSDIPAYLAARTPSAHYTIEYSLFITLPTTIKTDLRQLLGVNQGGGVFGHITHLLSLGQSVQSAVAAARTLYTVPGSLKRLRARYDLWKKTGDWVSLVNRAKAGSDWQHRDDGLPADFLTFCSKRFGVYKRADGKRQALLAIKRQWLTGRNSNGEREPIPGYGFRDSQPSALNSQLPPGWSYSNILRQIKAAHTFPRAVRALLHQSTSSARDFIPQVRSDRNTSGPDGTPLLFLGVVEFDDVKCDFLIIDPVTGQVCDLWLLVARDRATAILLGFGMRPARTREDGTQEHLRLRDMKQLCGWLLERYGLPPYEVIWKIEHGTATLSEGSRAALRELLPGRIDLSYSSMIGGTSPAGYQQRGTGNSKGKASLESHNRLMHTMLADQPGQTGPIYTKRPADLQSRAKEAAQIWQTTQHLPTHLRNQVGYPILTINQAREHLFRVFKLQNERTEHALQGFEDIVECWDATRNLWVPQSQSTTVGTIDGVGSHLFVSSTNSEHRPLAGDRSTPVTARVRKESPIERCSRLIAPYLDKWTNVSPDIITAFYEHTARETKVKDNGLIEFRIDGNLIEFMPVTPSPNNAPCGLAPGTRVLAYYHPDDPAFLHLTDGQGRILGTWIRRGRAGDRDTLQAAIRYSQSALKAAKATAAEYDAPERQRLEALRTRNAELLDSSTFTDVVGTTSTSSPLSSPSASPLSSPIATALTQSKAAVKAAAKQRAETTEDARAAFLSSTL
jgi:hypothetical protein